jgi:uncharacterized protein YoxC
MMICPSCSSSVVEGQEFCGQCGHRIRETVASLGERLAKVEAQLASRSDGKEQKYLESETVTNVTKRVQFWTTVFLFFAGISLAILAIAFAVIFGKGDYELKNIASNAKQSVNSVLDEAKSVAAGALSTANDARTKSQQANEEINSTQRRVTELKTLVDSRVAEAQKLDARIKESESAVTSLTAKVNSQEQQIAHISQQMNTIESQKGTATVKNAFPWLYGEHVAAWQDAYVAFGLGSNLTSAPLDAPKVSAVLQSLQDHRYRIVLGTVWLAATTGSANSGLPAAFGGSMCGPITPPCIAYFSETMKSKASDLRMLVNPVQPIPDDKVQYVAPSSLVRRSTSRTVAEVWFRFRGCIRTELKLSGPLLCLRRRASSSQLNVLTILLTRSWNLFAEPRD